jgi:hypothetical protein
MKKGLYCALVLACLSPLTLAQPVAASESSATGTVTARSSLGTSHSSAAGTRSGCIYWNGKWYC